MRTSAIVTSMLAWKPDVTGGDATTTLSSCYGRAIATDNMRFISLFDATITVLAGLAFTGTLVDAAPPASGSLISPAPGGTALPAPGSIAPPSSPRLGAAPKNDLQVSLLNSILADGPKYIEIVSANKKTVRLKVMQQGEAPPPGAQVARFFSDGKTLRPAAARSAQQQLLRDAQQQPLRNAQQQPLRNAQQQAPRL
ncbi:hypothetical protein THASP1DRAFT_21596 [Thamnocephalis sphaerospora]|uniref:Uncharacterized protein n=1 Tax=Thamnocephalis sphaerospora TaxID=78915 RepID=A0A4P9XWJ4_9FUNG|nr:hypothetical protein THASP1DRAFT_21596 [Thamnocephalis sphaerospora]|eukprot:RKP10725.1 hypothetical protein THASP1DRAFT_21596 [Thamnocephalis sphaerospora]